MNNCLKRAYGSLKLLYPHRKYLPLKTKKMLCNSLVLSQVDYCSQVFVPALDVADKSKIQRLQNSCLRFCFGIRKYDHISHKLLECKWLNMENRYLLNAVVFYHKIMLYKTPPYLYARLTFRTDVHNLNIRRKNTIYPPAFRTALFQRSFSFQIYKVYNSVPDSLKSLGVRGFRNEMFRRLWELQSGDVS